MHDYVHWHAPNPLYRLKCGSKVKTTEEEGFGACSLTHSTSGVKRRAGVSGWGLGRMISINYSHGLTQTKQQVG
jgi:hypothetical protein